MAPLALSSADAITRPRTKRVFQRHELKAVQRRMHDVIGDRIFDWMLARLSKEHHDLVDPEQLAAAAERNAFPDTCVNCIGKIRPLNADRELRQVMWSEPPCPAIQSIIDSVVDEERAKHGAFLLQDPSVVFGQIELQLVFDSPSATRRMKHMKTSCPKAFNCIKEFLCGPGYHLAPPKADRHDAWAAMMARLKFDLIRDNATPIYTELSKNWKKRHSPFEQFAHFLFFRDSMPAHATYNMLTHAQKPALIAAMAGDTTAFVMLARLGFAVPSDVQWQHTPFMKDMLDTRRFAVLRHLNTYFFRKQFKNPAPIVLATMRGGLPPSASLVSLGNSPSAGPAAHHQDPVMLEELTRTMAQYQPSRVWEARPPKKSSPGQGHRVRQSPMDAPSFAAVLPEMTTAHTPQMGSRSTPPGAGSGTAPSSWANIARKSQTSYSGSDKPSPAAKPATKNTRSPSSTAPTPLTKPADSAAAPQLEPLPPGPTRSLSASLLSPAAPPVPHPTPVPNMDHAGASGTRSPLSFTSLEVPTPAGTPATRAAAPPAAPAASTAPAAVPAPAPSGKKTAWGTAAVQPATAASSATPVKPVREPQNAKSQEATPAKSSSLASDVKPKPKNAWGK
jgi:hypothetical protein